jgi:hypothetical protein
MTMTDRVCDWCLVQTAIKGAGAYCYRPVRDPRNPKWLLTEIVVEGVVRATVSNPMPYSCVCARPPATAGRVYGNSSDPAWPHLCPECGYHACVIDDTGVILRCRNHACRHFDPILQAEIDNNLTRKRSEVS